MLAATVKEHASGDHSDLVLEGLTDLCKGGMLTDAEKVKEQADRLRGLFGRAAVKPTGEAKVKPADEGADDETHETPAFEGALLDLEFVAQMNALSGTPAQEAAGEEN